jgi:hypothetical protein
MSPHVACAPRGAALFPELSSAQWFDHQGAVFDDEEPSAAPTTDERPLSEETLVRLAQHFLDRSEILIDAVAPPAWEDEDDIFGGEASSRC